MASTLDYLERTYLLLSARAAEWLNGLLDSIPQNDFLPKVLERRGPGVHRRQSRLPVVIDGVGSCRAIGSVGGISHSPMGTG